MSGTISPVLVQATREINHQKSITEGLSGLELFLVQKLRERRDVKKRIANAKKDSTYLLAEVEIVATFKLANINRKRLEALLQKFFGSARLELELRDRFGTPVKPKEWFLVPLEVIEEVIEKVKEGTIDQFRYDPGSASLMRS